VLAVHQYQAGYGSQVHVAGAEDIQGGRGAAPEKVPDSLLLGTGEGKKRSGIQASNRHHGPKAVEIGIYMRCDEIHRG
jgi:hypothetical protein